MLILLGAVALVASVGDTNHGPNLNAASANTIVTFGRGELVMTATGAQSEWKPVAGTGGIRRDC